MTPVLDYLITLLQDLKSYPPVAQFGIVFTAVAFLPGVFGWLWLRIHAKQSTYAAKYDQAVVDLNTANMALKQQSADIAALRQTCPKSNATALDSEERDNNTDRANAIARDYLTAHQAMIARTSRIRLKHYLSLWEEGLPALKQARACAHGVLAAAPDDEEAADLLDEITREIRLEQADPETAEEARQKEERDRLRTLLDETPDDLGALLEVGNKMRTRGHYRIAQILFHRAERVARTEAYGGPNGPNHLTARHYSGGILISLGRAQEAEEAFTALLPDQQRVKGKDHPDTLTTRHELAAAILNQGRTQEAEAALTALLPDQQRIKGKDHPDTLTTRHDIAAAILNQGRAQEAEAALTALLPDEQRVKGKDHPHTLTTRHGIAAAILNQGRAQEAEAALTALLPDEQRVKGKDHPDTLTTRHTLARAILTQGRARKAEEALTALLPDQQRVKGKDHPDTLTTRYTLAEAILNQGRAQEAEAALTALLPDMQRVKGKDHPDTLTTRRLLARAALEQNAPDRAADALAPLPADGGDSNPLRQGQTAMLRGWLADLRGDADGAAELLDTAEQHLAHLEPEHYARRELAHYRATRVPGGAGGTMVWVAEGPDTA